jgi:hypothetical protein
MAEYVSRVVEERGKEDADRLHAEAMGTAQSGAVELKGKVRKKGNGEGQTN